MSGEIEAMGDLVGGMLTGRAVEPGHGEAGNAGEHGGRCLNCGAFLKGPYCDRCGQVGHVHRSVMAFIHDLLHGVLHFEGKMWRTIPLLFWRPGELTRRYISGERARFFSPLALFLFAVFLTFAVFSAMGSGLNSSAGPNSFDAMDEAERQSAINRIHEDMTADFRRIESEMAAARAAGRPTTDLERELATKRRVADGMDTAFGFGASATDDPTNPNHFTFTDLKTDVPLFDALIDKANADPALMLYKLQSNAYKYAWALIPLSAPFLWLLYPFSRRFGMYDHLVFVTYSLSFMLLLLVFTRVLAAMGVGAPIIPTLLTFYPAFHIYRQLRGTYRGSRFGALVRATIIVGIASTNLMIFMAGLLALGALG